MFNELTIEDTLIIDGGSLFSSIMKATETLFIIGCETIGAAAGIAVAGVFTANPIICGIGGAAGGYYGGQIGHVIWDGIMN